jgi:CheY-like chemotaxis protein
MRKILKLWNRAGKRARGGVSRGVPSLVHGISQVASHRVLRDIIASSNDRRQWGVLAAAWMGLSEREFMRRVAEQLGVELQETVPVPDLSSFGDTAAEVLQALRNVGAVPLMEGHQVVGFAAIDPAEVSALALYDGSQQVSLASWSEVSKALDACESLLGDVEATRHQEHRHAREALCLRVCELLFSEAQAHGASALDIVASQQGGEYRFVSSSGQTATGAIHAGAAPEVMNFLCSRPGNIVHSGRVGPAVVRMLGGPSHLRLSWGKAVASDERPPIALPAPQDASSKPSLVALKEVVANTSPSAPSILVVDDNLMFGRVLEKLLKREGFEPSFASNGAEAYDRLCQSAHVIPRVIVCDLHMPVMNGKEFLARLRSDARFKTVPVVMLTSDDDIEAEVGLLESGADAFVSKSKDPRVLCAQIRKFVRLSELQEAA